MILSLDMGSEVPIYVQLRNQIVTGIGKGELAVGAAASDSPSACTGCRSERDDSQ